jgi:hypothetical protein
MELRTERIRMIRGKDEFLVAPRGVDKLLSEGWTVLGANQDTPTPQEFGALPIDSGPIVVKPVKRKTK